MSQRKKQRYVDNAASVKAGDVIGFVGKSLLSHFINCVTNGIPFFGITHVGIMANDDKDRLLLFESTTLDPLPCVLTGSTFNGSQAHFLDDVIKNYEGWIYRYPLYRPLYEFENTRLTDFLLETVHTPYDQFGAARSAGIVTSTIESMFRPEGLASIFCSEWVAAAYSVVGLFPSSNASRWNPNHLIRHLRWNNTVLRPRRLK
jgi:hypothetical protein